MLLYIFSDERIPVTMTLALNRTVPRAAETFLPFTESFREEKPREKVKTISGQESTIV
jgi:hypothetical protein